MQEQNPPGETHAAVAAVPMADRYKRLATALISGAVMLTGAVVYTLSGETSGVSGQLLLAVLALLAGAASLVETVGYRTSALGLGLTVEEAREQSIIQYQGRMILRFAIIEAALVIPVALAFVLDGGVVVPVVLAGVGAVALMLVHVYPRERSISRTQESLERGGATSYLREALSEPLTPSI
jgi:hypothetical protein